MKDENKLARWLNDEMDGQELKEFMASPDYETYQKIRDYSAQLRAPETDMDALYNRIAQNRGRKKSSRVIKLSPWLTRIAAVLVIALGITFYFYAADTTTHVADAGQRTEFLLPDNSAVTLNAGSGAEFRTWNWDNNRTVELDGEAFFKVAKGKTFHVVTPLGKVTVVGTQFNVKARGNRFNVACFEGRVKVTANNETVELTPGKNVIFEDGKIIDMLTDNSLRPGWLNHEITFTGEPLEDVIAELERQFNIEIELNAKVADRYKGTIPVNDLNTALESIKTAYQLKSVKTGNTIVLSSE